MNIRYKIRDVEGERSLSEDRFPIIIGAGPTADIRIGDLKTEAEVAYIGLSQKRPFVEVGQSDVAVQYNHRKLDDSAWLMHADLLKIGSCQIHFKVEGSVFIIQVVSRQKAVDRDTPPTAADTDAALKIKPLSFRPQRRRSTTGSIRQYRRIIGWAIGLSFLLLIIAAWFVFTARQIMIQIEPSRIKFPLAAA